MVNVPVARLLCKARSNVRSGVCAREPEVSCEPAAADFPDACFGGWPSSESADRGRLMTNSTTIKTSPTTTATQVPVLIR